MKRRLFLALALVALALGLAFSAAASASSAPSIAGSSVRVFAVKKSGNRGIYIDLRARRASRVTVTYRDVKKRAIRASGDVFYVTFYQGEAKVGDIVRFRVRASNSAGSVARTFSREVYFAE
jgi:hypothetical protein